MIDLHKINGNEVIDFLNRLLKEEEDSDLIYEYNFYYDSFKFIDQVIKKDEDGIETYHLFFSAGYNNWGKLDMAIPKRWIASLKNFKE